jgi:hypothetical protein
MAKAKKRNPFAFDPIMKKGGFHQTSEKSKRKNDKQNLKKALIDSHDSAFFSSLICSLQVVYSPLARSL